jgi:hypothetical protein
LGENCLFWEDFSWRFVKNRERLGALWRRFAACPWLHPVAGPSAQRSGERRTGDDGQPLLSWRVGDWSATTNQGHG